MNNRSSLINAIKLVAFAAALSGAVAARSFAADVGESNQPLAQTTTAHETTSQAETQMQVNGKTRAQVNQELIAAEKSGELARKNAHYYGGH